MLRTLLAAKNNKTIPETIDKLINSGTTIDHVVDEATGDTLLHWLCQNAPLPFLYRQLGRYNTYFDLKNNSGQTCFTQAITAKRQSLIHMLVHFDDNNIFLSEIYHYLNAVQSLPTNKMLRLHAVDYGPAFSFMTDFAKATTFVDKVLLITTIYARMTLTTPCDEDDNTLIHFLIAVGHLDDIDYVLQLFARHGEIDCQNRLGETALMQAAFAAKQNVVSLLVAHGASITITDNSGQSAQRYGAMAIKPIIFTGRINVELHNEINTKINHVKSPEDLLNLMSFLGSKGLSLLSLINHNDNSILLNLIHKAPICVLARLFRIIKPSALSITNLEGETILDTTIRMNLRVKSSLLVGFGAVNSRYLVTSEYLARHPINVYLLANHLLNEFMFSLNIDNLVNGLNRLGLRIDEPIDEHDNSALHRLVQYLPCALFKLMVAKNPACNLMAINYFGQSVMDAAAQFQRYPLIHTLKNWAPIPQTHAQRYSQYEAGTKFPTLYQYFLSTFLDADVEHLDVDSKVIHYFNIYMSYIRKQKLRYDGQERDGTFLLDCEYGQSYKVNCYDLSAAFGYLLLELGIFNLQIHLYKNKVSRRFNDKGKLKGDFVCFDADYHQAHYGHDGFYVFIDHYVLKVGSRFFDPTFCCHYDNENDPLDIPTEITVSANYCIVSNATVSRTFNLRFIAGLNVLFDLSTWHYEYKGKNLYIHSESGELEIIQTEDHIHFSSKGVRALTLSMVLSTWYKTLPPTKSIQFSVHCENANDENYIIEEVRKFKAIDLPIKKRQMRK